MDREAQRGDVFIENKFDLRRIRVRYISWVSSRDLRFGVRLTVEAFTVFIYLRFVCGNVVCSSG